MTPGVSERPWLRLLPWLVLGAPFGAALYWTALVLTPIETPDSFAYLWRAPFTPYFFTGRSLSARLLFALGGEQPRLIALLQLACFAVTAGAFLAFARRTTRSPFALLVAAVVIALVSTSYNYSLVSSLLVPEPLFMCLMLAFPLALVAARGKHRGTAVVALGALLAFSKNVAPPITLAMLGAYAIVAAPSRFWVTPRASLAASAPYGAVAALALLASAVTQVFDTSTALNAANDVYLRVLPNDAETRHFHDVHGMPLDDVEAFRGVNVIARVKGAQSFHIDPVTNNYALTPEGRPLVQWIAERGTREYVRHAFLHEPLATYGVARDGFREYYEASNVTLLASYAVTHANDVAAARRNLKELRGGPGDDETGTVFDEAYYLAQYADIAAAVKSGAIASARDHYERYGRDEGRSPNAGAAARAEKRDIPAGLLGTDPLGLAVTAFAALTNGSLAVVVLALFASLLVARRAGGGGALAVGGIAGIGAVVAFVLGFVGDALEQDRHVAPATVTLTTAFVLVFCGVLGVLREALTAPYRRSES